MAKWLLLHVNNGKTLGGAVLLNETRMREMSAPHVSLPSGFASAFNLWKPDYPITFASHAYGYGWFLGTYRGGCYSFNWMHTDHKIYYPLCVRSRVNVCMRTCTRLCLWVLTRT